MARFKSTPTDGVQTNTSITQSVTEDTLATLFELCDTNRYKINRNAHLNFTARLIFQGFPRRYISQDASQPWLLFWNLQALQTLGISFDANNRQRAIATILRTQHPKGGFGGGPAQNAHLLSNYAAVCTLAIMGSPGPEGGWDQIDRKAMYEWFMSLKEPDGSFLVCLHGEVDMRGIYCLLVVATMLNLLTPELVRGLREFVASCQTYEGGFSAASQPYFSASPPSPETLLSSPRPPLGEAHGGYSFCALASLTLLEAVDPHPDPTKWMGIDVKRLYRWATSLQALRIELGGFRGRTNKLVDGCYSWWVGGLFPILADIMGGARDAPKVDYDESLTAGITDEWTGEEDCLFNRQALQRFVLISSQSESGGLRDKPSRPSDAYHTLYNLSGLSSAQHRVRRTAKQKGDVARKWASLSANYDSQVFGDHVERFSEDVLKNAFVASMSWEEDEPASRYVAGIANRLNATHPIFDLTTTTTKGMINHFYHQDC